MPKYGLNKDLLLPVRKALPGHGQNIYREAFNSAWEQYADPSERRNPQDSCEEAAHKVARAAVWSRSMRKGLGESGDGRRRSSRFVLLAPDRENTPREKYIQPQEYFNKN